MASEAFMSCCPSSRLEVSAGILSDSHVCRPQRWCCGSPTATPCTYGRANAVVRLRISQLETCSELREAVPKSRAGMHWPFCGWCAFLRRLDKTNKRAKSAVYEAKKGDHVGRWHELFDGLLANWLPQAFASSNPQVKAQASMKSSALGKGTSMVLNGSYLRISETSGISKPWKSLSQFSKHLLMTSTASCAGFCWKAMESIRSNRRLPASFSSLPRPWLCTALTLRNVRTRS